MASEPPRFTVDIPVEYILDRSRSGLKNLSAIKQNRSANLRKQIFELANQWAEEIAFEMFCEWMIVHGEELIVLAADPHREPKKLIKVEPKEHFHDSLTKPYRYEFWRSEQRRNRKRAG